MTIDISFSSIYEKIKVYGRMIKFSHTIFALPFALSAVVLAHRETQVTFSGFFWILVAMVSARSAAMGFNRVADYKIDAKNPRTDKREIPSGEISLFASIAFIMVFSVIFIFSAYMLGKLCFILSFPVLLVLFLYSLVKRFSAYCHIFLGFAIGLSPLGAWIAVTGTFSFAIIPLCLALMANIAGFDILYACQDTEFDKENNLFSIPSKYGIKKAMRFSTYLHIISFVLFLLIQMVFSLGTIYFISVMVIGVALVIEHILVNPDDLTNINIAFFHMNSIISVALFTGIFLDVLI
ncbi:MAG: UbiA family prenyltransferase [Deltaproteobacteria bacterium]|nr:UbiA family prenyltransferase [Deltaproteobacteria bacterium]